MRMPLRAWRAAWEALPRMEAERQLNAAAVASLPYMEKRDREGWYRRWTGLLRRAAVAAEGVSVRRALGWFREALGRGVSVEDGQTRQ